MTEKMVTQDFYSVLHENLESMTMNKLTSLNGSVKGNHVGIFNNKYDQHDFIYNEMH